MLVHLDRLVKTPANMILTADAQFRCDCKTVSRAPACMIHFSAAGPSAGAEFEEALEVKP